MPAPRPTQTTTNGSTPQGPLTNLERAAVLMLLFGERAAAAVLRSASVLR